MPQILTRILRPLAAKKPQSMNDPPPYLVVDMKWFSMYASLFWCWICHQCTWTQTIAPRSSHSCNDEIWILWLCFIHAPIQKKTKKPFGRKVPFYGWFWDLVTPRDNKTLQFLNGYLWVALCLFPLGLIVCRDNTCALMSSSWQVCNCSRCLKCSNY